MCVFNSGGELPHSFCLLNLSINPPHVNTAGVSVCLRFIADYPSYDYYTIFSLSTSRNSLKLQASEPGRHKLFFDWSSSSLSFRPIIKFWPNIGQDIWTRVCVTVDFVKNLAQVFQGSNMSIKKKLPRREVRTERRATFTYLVLHVFIFATMV